MTQSPESGAASAAWSAYWRSGQQHSLFNDGKALRMDGYWSGFLESLPAGGAVLDLACGAGALTRLAVDHPGRFAVTAVDYARDIAPIDGARLDTGFALEALPYANAQFDAAISQYGIEYGEPARSLAEVTRVLRPEGRFAFLCHASEGASLGQARQGSERLSQLLAPGGLVSRVETYGHDLARATTAPPDSQPVAEAFKACAAGPLDETSRWALSFLGEIMTNALKFEPAYVLNNAAVVRTELARHRERLSLMVAAARSNEGISELAAIAKEAGLLADAPKKVIDLGGAQIGWWVEGRRSL